MESLTDTPLSGREDFSAVSFAEEILGFEVSASTPNPQPQTRNPDP